MTEKENTAAPEDFITAYLRKIGLLDLADQQFVITVQIGETTEVKVPLIGKQNHLDAIEYLIENGWLTRNKRYKFENWPVADPRMGEWHYNVGACVCELDTQKIYRIPSYDRRYLNRDWERSVLLYGCPNAKSILESTVLDKMTVEVVDYGD